MEIIVMKNDNLLARRVKVADTFWARLQGLLGQKELKEGQGLLLKPCRQVHTWFMRFAIDVIFLDEYGKIVGMQQEMEAGRISPRFEGAWQALELAPGSIEKYALRKGDYLEFIHVE